VIDRTTAPGDPGVRRGRVAPYLLVLPAVLWLAVFFVWPAVQLFGTSLYDPQGSPADGYPMVWAFGNYPAALAEYGPHLARSLLYAAVATAACLVLGFPLAYAIALKAGRWRNLLLIAVIAPFLTSFLVRTLAWKTILSDHGVLVGVLRDLHLLDPDGRLLATPFAVIAGLTYNFLPFTVLPLYAGLERLDPRLLAAAGDLYAGPVATFRRVTPPLAAPGIVAGTLLTFIPAAGDYINAKLLGTPQTAMIGNAVRSAFLVRLDYPQAAALSFVLMAAVLLLVMAYLRRVGPAALDRLA
jgi:spermidine/putrescine transport system permease protein